MTKINSNRSYLETEQINSKSKNVHQTAYDVAKSGKLERVPQKDTLEKKNNTGRNLTLGALVLLAVGAGVEVFKFHGKHFDDIVSKVKKKWGNKTSKPEPPKAPEPPKTPDVPKAPETKKPEIIEIEGQKIRVKKAEAPKLLQGVDRSQYPKKYVKDGFEVKEQLLTLQNSGDEYVVKDFYQNGKLVKEEFSQHGSTIKSFECFYKDGIQEKRVSYKEDGVTKMYERVFDSSGKKVETRYFDDKGLNVIRVEKAEVPKLLQGVDRSQYPKKYIQDGFEVIEEFRTLSSSGDEYISKDFYQNGKLVKEESSRCGSTLKAFERLYKDGIKERIVYYKEDGITKSWEQIYDSSGKVIESHHFD